jgi:hypothetical protein
MNTPPRAYQLPKARTAVSVPTGPAPPAFARELAVAIAQHGMTTRIKRSVKTDVERFLCAIPRAPRLSRPFLIDLYSVD